MAFNLEYIWKSFSDDIMKMLTGYMGFITPLWIVGTIILAIDLFLGIYCMYIIMKKYRETEDINTLIFFTSGLSLFISLGILTVLNFAFPTSYMTELRQSLAITGLLSAVTSMTILDLFAFRSTYPEHVKLLTAFVVILSVIFAGASIWAGIEGPPSIMYHPTLLIISYCTLIGPAAIGPAIFFYYAIKVKKEDKPKSDLSFTFGLGLLLAVISVISELGMISAEVFVMTVFRFLGLAFIIIFVIVWKMPDWYKRMIGWSD